MFVAQDPLGEGGNSRVYGFLEILGPAITSEKHVIPKSL